MVNDRDGSERTRVLLVTGSARVRAQAAHDLAEARIQTVGGERALRAALSRGGFDLVVSDDSQPWPDGLVVLRQVKAHALDCPVILLLERAQPDRIRQAVEAGVDDYVPDLPESSVRLPLAVRICLDRARSVESLRQAEAHYRELFESIPVGLYRTSTTGLILDANRELSEMLGYSDRESLLSRNAADLYAQPRERRVILSQHGGESVLHAVEVQLRRADGRAIWVEDHARVVRDARGKVQAYEGSLLDVTRRKEAERALRASEERFRALVQNATDVITTLDADGVIQSVTPSAESVLGYAPDDLVGQNGLSLIHPDDLPLVQHALLEVVQRTNPGTPTEFRFRHANGEWVYLEAVGNNLLNRPEIGAIVLTARAITERKQAEAALRESERRLSTLLGNLPGMAYRCRNDRQRTMEFVSDGCMGLTGFSAAELVGRRTVSYASLVHPDDQEPVWQEVQSAVREGRRFQVTYRIATAEGESLWVWEQGGAVGVAADGVEGLEGFVTDISDRRATEEELRDSRAGLQHVVEAVDDLLVVYDRDGRYADIITRDASLLIRPASEMLGRTVMEILPEETARRFLAGIKIILTQGSPYEFEYPLELPGGLRWFRARGRRVRAADGGPPRTLWAISDVTAHKAAEQGLLRQSRQLEILSRTSQQLNTVLEIPAVLRTLVAAGMELVDAAAGTAGLWINERMRFSEYNNDGLLRPIDSALAVGEGVPGVVAETHAPYLANDPVADRLLSQAGPDLGIHNLVNVPILSRDGVLLGCLETHNKRQGQAFDEADVSMLEGLASSAAVALENAHLLQERLRAEDELRQLKEFNEDIVLSMGEGIIVQDRMGEFTFVNPAAAEMLGYSPEELLNVPWTKVVPPDQRAIVSAVDTERAQGTASRYEVEFVRKDGSRLPALVSGSPRFKEGRFEGMLAVFADISDRKEAERALQESEEQFRSVAQQSPNMIFINQGGRIVYVNPQCSAVMGYRPEEFLADGFGFQQLVAPDSMPVVRDAFARHARGEDVAPYEYELVTREGELLTVINATKLITFRGKPAILGVVTDITERKRAEEDLRRERDLSDTVINSLPGIFYMVAEEGWYVRWNRRAEEVLGYAREEMASRTVRDFFPESEQEMAVRAVRDVFEQGQGEMEADMVTRDGRTIPFYFTGVRATIGEQRYVVGVGIDITDRKRAEQALRASEARFRAFFEHAGVGIALTDEAGRVIESNAALQAMLGVREVDLHQRSQWDLIHADDASMSRHLFDDLCQGRRAPYQIETRYLHGDGHPIPTRLTVSRIPGGESESVTAIWMVEDIAERKRAEEALRESERRFRMLVERAADAVFLHDLEGRIIDINQQACESVGYSREELVGMNVNDIEAQVASREQRELWRQTAAGGPRTLNGTHRRKDGSTFPVELRIGAFDIDGRPYILALARDVTERRKADEALRETTETLQALVQAAPVGVTVVDLEGRVRLWNPAAEHIFLVPASKVVDQALEALRDVQAENVAAFVGIQQRLLRGETVSDVEVRTYRSDGELVDVTVSAAPLRDSDGRIQALMGVFADVTDRKRAEAAIERHARVMSVLYETSLEVARRSDALGILEVIVAQAAGLLGARMGGIYLASEDGASLELAVIHNMPPEYRGMRLALGEGLSGRVAQTGEAETVNDYAAWKGRFPGYDGAPFRRVVAAPLKRAGKVIGVIDITDDARTDPFEADEIRVVQLFADQAAASLENARLLEETRRRAAHLEAVTSVATALRTSRTRQETLTIVAERLQELLLADGLLLALQDPSTRESVIELSVGVWADLSGARQDSTEGLVGRAMASGQPVMEAHAGDLLEAQRPLKLNGVPALALVPLVAQEHVLGVIGVGRATPFTEGEGRLLVALAEVVGNALRRASVLETLEERVRSRTQELADANLRLTELDRLKSDFVSNVSHELRTPITNVLLYLDLLGQPGREDRRDSYMGVLRREAERLGHLIEDLLTLSRMDQAALKINLELRALDPLLAEIQAVHRARAQSKGTHFGLEPNPDVPPVWLDYLQIVQVLNNLVGNAIAYTPAGGHVTLSSLVRDRWEGGQEVGARVHNDGPTIPAEDLPHLFERFYRGLTGRESGEPGTGLGLAICKEIVDRHGGRIDLESSEERGTSFTVWLPVGAPA